MHLDSDLILNYTGEQDCSPQLEMEGSVWETKTTSSSTKRKLLAFEPMSKRKRGYPSEKAVKRGRRIVHGDKELCEKLGKDDLCPCGSGRRFQTVLPQQWQI